MDFLEELASLQKENQQLRENLAYKTGEVRGLEKLIEHKDWYIKELGKLVNERIYANGK